MHKNCDRFFVFNINTFIQYKYSSVQLLITKFSATRHLLSRATDIVTVIRK